MEVNLYTVFYLFGALQTLVIGLVLMRRSSLRQLSKRILLALLISIFLVLVHYSLLMNGLAVDIAWIGPFGWTSWYMISPLMYLYFRAVTSKGFSFRWSHPLLFFVPVYMLTQFVLESCGIFFGFHMLFESMALYSYAWLIAYHAYALVFGLVMFVTLQEAMAKEKNEKKGRQYAWMKYFTLAYLSGLLISIIGLFITANAEIYHDSYEWLFIAIFELFVFVVVIKSLRVSSFLEPRKESEGFSEEKKPAGDDSKDERQNSKYANSTLGASELEEIHIKLVAILEKDKLYLDNKLSLTTLSEASGIPENHLSQFFSQFLNGNFYDFVNKYRLRELERRLLDPEYRHLKIASLAEDCGFNSKSSFYRYFKSVHGMTPTEYLKKSKTEMNAGT